MKRYLYILTIMLSTFMLVTNVKAEDLTTTYQVMEQDYIPISVFDLSSASDGHGFGTNTWIYNNFTEFYKNSRNKEIFDTLYDEIMEAYSIVRNDYPYYKLSVLISSSSSDSFRLYGIGLRLRIYNNSAAEFQCAAINNFYKLGTYYSVFIDGDSSYTNVSNILSTFSDAGFTIYDTKHHSINYYESIYVPFNSIAFRHNDNGNFYLPTLTFETNTHHIIQGTTDIWELYDSDANLLGTYEAGDEYPSMYSEGEFSNTDNLVTVNLNSYAYVILSLKDRTKTDAFSSKLKVKGSIGITPVYDYGTLEKPSSITDRCNASYDNFTSYYLYVSSDDLTNNSVYYIKACETNSSFKYDSTVFDISFFTSESASTTFTIDGKEYSTIPFNQLSSTANLNEENNYIPGASENAITGNSVGLTAILKNVKSKLSEIWSIFTYFMTFVNQIFSVLPEEIRTVLVASFTIGCVLGLIKILKF